MIVIVATNLFPQQITREIVCEVVEAGKKRIEYLMILFQGPQKSLHLTLWCMEE